MRALTKARLRLRSLLRRGRVEQELDDELRYHLQRLADEYEAAGLSPGDARLQARRDMGAIESNKEECRDARGLTLIDSLRQDVSYAVRALRKSPGFSTIAILSLAIGIGANTTIFTFVNAVLLKPLPFPAADRLVVFNEQPLESGKPLAVHPVNFVAWRSRARSFDALALVQTPPLNVMGAGGAEQIPRLSTSSDLFRVFGVHPVLGRAFTEEDSRGGGAPVVILGYGFWQRWFGGDPGVLGRPLTIPGGSLTIVGVAPPAFGIGLTQSEVFTPLPLDPANPAATGSRAFEAYGRLAPGATLASAQAEMAVIATDLRQQHRFDEGMGVLISDLHEFLSRESRPGLRLLMLVVATVLAIGCVNLAGLLLARGITRRSELALRAALGASRGRLIRQLIVESLVLSACGGVAGLALAYWATQALSAVAGGALSSGATGPIRLDATCLTFTVAASILTALVFGLIPARQASQINPESALRERSRSGTGDRRQHRLRKVLVVSEVALAVVLLVGAGLLLRTLTNLGRVPLGFEASKTLTMGMFLGMRPPEARIAAVDQMLDRIEQVPGVVAAGTIQFMPLRGLACGTGFWTEEFAGAKDPSRSQPTECGLVSRGYFAAMAIPVLEGRTFGRVDRTATSRVLVVSQAFARRYFPNGAVGRRILMQSSNQALAEIVGVVGDVHHNGLTIEPVPTVYLLHAQTPGYITNLVVRTAGEPSAYAAAIRSAIHEADPTQAVSAFATLERDVDKVLARPRLQALLVAVFAAIAVVLAVIGVYGLLAYVVTQRSREIGIRLALGATAAAVFRQLLGEGVRLVVAGLLLGLATTVVLRSLVSAMVFGVTTADPVSYGAAAVVFLVVGLIAAAIPARRGSMVEPTTALKCE